MNEWVCAIVPVGNNSGGWEQHGKTALDVVLSLSQKQKKKHE
jgi:hypothetical protein